MLLLAVMEGCAPVGPDFEGVESVKTPKSWRTVPPASKSHSVRWWHIFHDSTLNRLVKMVYEKNLDIESAGLRILQARALLGISESMYSPQLRELSANAMLSRKDEKSIRSAALAFDLGWELDIWGRYAREEESSRAELYAAVAGYQQTVASIIAETAKNYISYRMAEERIVYAKYNIVIQERVARLTEIQFNAGNVSELDMQQARTQLYTTRATLPALELEKVKAANAIAVLLGTTAERVERLLEDGTKRAERLERMIVKDSDKGLPRIEKKDLGRLDISLIPIADFDPYAKIDADLLTRRPDLRVLEYKARSANAKTGMAVAALYPSFSLLGNIGYSANDALGSWTSPGRAIGALFGPSLSWNIFQYERIKNNIRVQDAAFETALLEYDKKAIQAISEVSNALKGYLLTKRQLAENRKALEATVRAFNLSVTQYNDGLVSYQRLLTTVQNLTLNQDRFAQIKGALSIQAVALYKALGGGWEISAGDSYLSQKTIERMKGRVDWGTYLEKEKLKLAGVDG